MAEMRRCNRCAQVIPSDAPEDTCPACELRDGPGPDARPTSGPAGEGSTLGLEPVEPGHVLETLDRSIGPIPRVLLPDAGTDATNVADTVPSSDEGPAPAGRVGRYHLFGEIARGGMGAVLRGRDPDLGRDLAVKVLLAGHEGDPAMVRRFVEEAQIGGQLQHPGIVPVYELGAFADRRPYFTMKLVDGRTLSALLAGRPSPAHDLPRFLSVFEAVCQTVAYAHARGVIHRDLKPSNVMVGSFGEVQVMDWGLAKVLKEGGLADESPGGPTPGPGAVATLRSGSGADESRTGSVLGTPSHMSPEQAGGELERVDRRSDVFGLGSILCEILTGHRVYTGGDTMEVLRRAMAGDTADALARLDGCGAEGELVALARDCLACEPADRPRDAGVVAGRITAYLAGVQERVRAAERERAVAVAKAVEERRRRKVQVALAASVLALATLGGLSAAYVYEQRQARAAAGQRIIDQVATLHDQALGQPEEISRWEVALAAVEQADPAGDPGTKAQLLALRSTIQAGLDAARRDRALIDRLVDIRSAEADDEDGSITDRDYAEAFLGAGIDLAGLPPAEAGARIKARPPSVATALAGALDDWAAIRQGRQTNAAGAVRLREAAGIADPDPWRVRLRTALDRADQAARRSALQALAKEAKYDELGPISLHLLGTGLDRAGDGLLAESVLRRAQRRHPRDVWVNYELGRVLEAHSHRDDAIRFYTVARAIRPETAHELAHALSNRGESDEAIEIFQELARLRPGDGRHAACLAENLKERGRSKEAAAALERGVASLREAIRLRPGAFAAHINLGRALLGQGKLDEAVTEYREAIRLQPDSAQSHHNLGIALSYRGKHDECAAEFREAIRLRPDYAEPHYALGNILSSRGQHDEAIAEFREAIRVNPGSAISHEAFGRGLDAQGKRDEAIAEYREAIRARPDLAVTHSNLGNVLYRRGKVDEAYAEWREAIRLRPDYAPAHYNFGLALYLQGKHDEAVARDREAIRLQPDYYEAHFNLGLALQALGKHDEATAEFRTAARLQPDNAEAHYNLGNVLKYRGKRDEAAAAYREAIRARPDKAEAHCNLGLIRLAEGDYAGAVESLRRGHELGTKQAGWSYPSAQWVAQAERTAAMAGRLPALLRGEERPKDTLERLAVAQMFYDRQCHAAAARFWAEALEADPKLVDDRQAGHRYNAACAAALAGAGQGKDVPPPDDAAKARLRQQARDWLEAERIAWTRLLESGPPQARPAIVQTLGHWRQDGDLAGIRDVEALAKLTPDEREACRTLWADVDSLVRLAATPGARETKPDGAGKARAPEAPARPKPSATR